MTRDELRALAEECGLGGKLPAAVEFGEKVQEDAARQIAVLISAAGPEDGVRITQALARAKEALKR